ncbi:RES family NAD+ phosphorylase [Dyadobacter sp. CY347]|uniref:RES family NAD+ phosphorylase n=1 Tax=Dyadobacter sp. CY347 TaxID=2909336 RepID=UPI001F176D95|nr:RES family NAD+ phosphorylase [Dyadobacter sp. CY347]MCF2491410.1 RES family NAD+ phosphorylase [Dyadobacter sp. CY347]
MELFRITRTIYKDDLTGIGAFHYGGRWNSPGRPMLYASSHRSLSMLEVLVHSSRSTPPPDYVIVVLFVPDSIKSLSAYTVQDWQQDPQWSKSIGDEWLEDNKSLLLRVPSVVVTSEYNYLINTAHPDASEIKVVQVEPFEFDKRLFFFSKSK